MTEGGSVEKFLGIKVNSLGDGAYKLTQEGLIDKILKTTRMENCNPAVTPTSGPKPLGPDPYSKDVQLQDRWSYALVVGMMMYLASNIKPKITFVVHQCARFSHGTKHLHEKAILQICKYLKETQSEGLIIKLNMKEMLQ
eukprot:6737061-Ditylum_brightwellii.AAC.1